jgi:hypothetical protein
MSDSVSIRLCAVSSRTPSGEWRSCSTLPVIMRSPRRWADRRRPDRGDVRGREGQRRGHAVAQQLVEEDLGHRRRVGGLGEAALGGKGVVLQPWQQAVGRRADDVGLWEVDVHVHEARRQDAARPGASRPHRDASAPRDVGARVDHALAAVGIGCRRPAGRLRRTGDDRRRRIAGGRRGRLFSSCQEPSARRASANRHRRIATIAG